MADSFQKEKPPSRINLFLELEEGDASEKVELPMRMLVLGNYTDADEDVPVDEREIVNVNSNNFESVMESSAIEMDYQVEDRLSEEEGKELPVSLDIEDMSSFDPEQVAEQIPQLRRMVAVRNLLQDLRNRVVSTSEFRKQLNDIVQDEEALGQLSEELDRLVAAEEEAAPEEASSEEDA